MVATNTGGARLLRYGDVRRSLLGLEVVLADTDATVWSDLTGLRKDNSGVDLKQMFVGTSGAFGIITRVQVELQRIPRQTATALVVPTSHAAIPALITWFEAQAGEFRGAFEGMSANAMAAALSHNSRLRNPFGDTRLPDYAVLIELVGSVSHGEFDLSELLAELLGQVMEGEVVLVKDACLGSSTDLWAIRHSISEGVRACGPVGSAATGCCR
jgi:FAD/FMN-containing dehydrogenase